MSQLVSTGEIKTLCLQTNKQTDSEKISHFALQKQVRLKGKTPFHSDTNKSTVRVMFAPFDDTASAYGAWMLQSVLNWESRHYLLSKKGIYSDSLDAHAADQSPTTGPANNVSWGLQMELHTGASCIKETSVNKNRPWVTSLCWCWGRARRPWYSTCLTQLHATVVCSWKFAFIILRVLMFRPQGIRRFEKWLSSHVDKVTACIKTRDGRTDNNPTHNNPWSPWFHNLLTV